MLVKIAFAFSLTRFPAIDRPRENDNDLYTFFGKFPIVFSTCLTLISIRGPKYNPEDYDIYE